MMSVGGEQMEDVRGRAVRINLQPIKSAPPQALRNLLAGLQSLSFVRLEKAQPRDISHSSLSFPRCTACFGMNPSSNISSR